MEIFKQATKLGLRIQTSKGVLNVEQLWQLSQNDLSSAIKAVKKVLKKNDNDDDLSFLESTKVIDIENQLRFDILKDIYLSKMKETEELRDADANKKHNQRILALIAEKQEGKLRDMSVEELEKLLK